MSDVAADPTAGEVAPLAEDAFLPASQILSNSKGVCREPRDHFAGSRGLQRAPGSGATK
jgi:hypothetical protein